MDQGTLVANSDLCRLALLPKAVDSRHQIGIFLAWTSKGKDIVRLGRDAHEMAGIAVIRPFSLSKAIDGIVLGLLWVFVITMIDP